MKCLLIFKEFFILFCLGNYIANNQVKLLYKNNESELENIQITKNKKLIQICLKNKLNGMQSREKLFKNSEPLFFFACCLYKNVKNYIIAGKLTKIHLISVEINFTNLNLCQFIAILFIFQIFFLQPICHIS